METIWRGLCMDKETLWLCKQTNKNAPDLAHKYCHPSNKFSTSLSCQRWKHVNSCDIVMRWESLPSAPIRAPVSSPAAPAWLHLPAIMNCQHRSLPHLHRPFFPVFFRFGLPHFNFPLASHTMALIYLSVKHKQNQDGSKKWEIIV